METTVNESTPAPEPKPKRKYNSTSEIYWQLNKDNSSKTPPDLINNLLKLSLLELLSLGLLTRIMLSLEYGNRKIRERHLR